MRLDAACGNTDAVSISEEDLKTQCRLTGLDCADAAVAEPVEPLFPPRLCANHHCTWPARERTTLQNRGSTNMSE